uniref:G-protein coupled receptors family 1 profile domain-containing protein n=1 Tax=Erpetoichthys calabaricus TaxID=27687 RepID=A0A8C4RER9_ERPCA
MITNFTRIVPFCSIYGTQKWYCYVLLILCSLALPVGILGNMAALLNYICCLKSWSSSKILLFNLAICDFVWVLTIPVSIYLSLQKPPISHHRTFCKLKSIIFNINVYGSILFLTLISFDRYAGTVHPISSLKWWNKRKVKICSFVVWIILLLESIPNFLLNFTVRKPDNTTACFQNIHAPVVYFKTVSIVRIIFGFLIPCVIMFTCYIMTVRVLRQLNQNQSLRRRPSKPLVLVNAAMVVFAISFVPYHIMIMTLLFLKINNRINHENYALYASYGFFETICSISSCLDPILYILASDRFQKNCKDLKSHHERILVNCFRSRKVGDLS